MVDKNEIGYGRHREKRVRFVVAGGWTDVRRMPATTDASMPRTQKKRHAFRTRVLPRQGNVQETAHERRATSDLRIPRCQVQTILASPPQNRIRTNMEWHRSSNSAQIDTKSNSVRKRHAAELRCYLITSATVRIMYCPSPAEIRREKSTLIDIVKSACESFCPRTRCAVSTLLLFSSLFFFGCILSACV